MKIPQNFMKNSQTFMKNSQKFTCHVFPPLLIRKEDIWVISRIQFGAQWTRPRVQKFKSEMFLINWQALGTQEISFWAFSCTGARDMTPQNPCFHPHGSISKISTLVYLLTVQYLLSVQPLNSEFLPVRFLFTCY